MKKLFLPVMAMLLLAACDKTDFNAVEEEDLGEEVTRMPEQRSCDADRIYQEELATNPEFRRNQENLEAFIAQYAENVRLGVQQLASPSIPVVVNVLYRSTSENISAAQIQSQIDVLNKDFNALNSEYGTVPTDFAGVKANVGVTFTLQATVRKKTNKRSWTTNNDMKRSSRGGIDPTPGALNIWVCTLGGGILGYAQFPGGSAATDGVVLLNTATGTTGTARAPFNLGRTGTHEVGHWLNLRHIWGDATCGNDFVGDTPLHNTANYGCPAQPHFSTCSGSPREMTMNYMDYTDDRCMYMFSIGQRDRMLAAATSRGY